MSLNFYQGATTTQTTLQVSQSLFDSAVAEISARNKIPIESLLKILFRNDVSGYWTQYEPGSPVAHSKEDSPSVSRVETNWSACCCSLIFISGRKCYVTSVVRDNRKMLCNKLT